jgi:hypothetical protein
MKITMQPRFCWNMAVILILHRWLGSLEFLRILGSARVGLEDWDR